MPMIRVSRRPRPARQVKTWKSGSTTYTLRQRRSGDYEIEAESPDAYDVAIGSTVKEALDLLNAPDEAYPADDE